VSGLRARGNALVRWDANRVSSKARAEPCLSPRKRGRCPDNMKSALPRREMRCVA
jgi:hypothetical protein